MLLSRCLLGGGGGDFGSLGSGAVGFLGVGGAGFGSLLGTLPTSVRSLGTGVGAQHLAGLEDLLEPAQGVLEPATGVGADHRGQLLADTASGVGAERDAHLGAPITRSRRVADLG